MRALLALPLCFASFGAWADDWSAYRNSRYGFAIDVPPNFEMQPPPGNDDGRTFLHGDASLLAYASAGMEDDFATNIAYEIDWASKDGWLITYQSVKATSASFSGTKGDLILYSRRIAICDGVFIAHFDLQYPAEEREAYDTVIPRLVSSLAQDGVGSQCS